MWRSQAQTVEQLQQHHWSSNRSAGAAIDDDATCTPGDAPFAGPDVLGGHDDAIAVEINGEAGGAAGVEARAADDALCRPPYRRRDDHFVDHGDDLTAKVPLPPVPASSTDAHHATSRHDRRGGHGQHNDDPDEHRLSTAHVRSPDRRGATSSRPPNLNGASQADAYAMKGGTAGSMAV